MKLFLLLLMISTFAGCNSISKTDVVSEPIVDSEEECLDMIVSEKIETNTIDLFDKPAEEYFLNTVSEKVDTRETTEYIKTTSNNTEISIEKEENKTNVVSNAEEWNDSFVDTNEFVPEIDEETYDSNIENENLSEVVIPLEPSINDDAPYEGPDANDYNPSTRVESIITTDDSITVILKPIETNVSEE